MDTIVLSKQYETRLRVQILVLLLASIAIAPMTWYFFVVVLANQNETADSSDFVVLLSILAAIGLYYGGVYVARKLLAYLGHEDSKIGCILYIPLPLFLVWTIIMPSRIESLIDEVKTGERIVNRRPIRKRSKVDSAKVNVGIAARGVLRALAEQSSPRDMAWFVQMLQHQDKETRKIAAQTLGRGRLTTLLDDANESVRNAAREGLEVLTST